MPEFLMQHREYAKRTTLGMRYSTAEERARAHDVMKRIQKVQTPGVPRGM
jgi:hypothetical protein